MKIVLQKYISGSGFCSRRMAEDFIRAGQVKVNDEKAELGMRVDGSDKVEVSGKILKLQTEKVYIKFNKPRGVTCTNRKFEGEKNVFSFLPEEHKSLHVVGRLDKDSSGLVILTNDGELTQKITHPSFQHEKKYIVSLQNNKKRNMYELQKKFIEGIDLGEDGIVRAKSIKQLKSGAFEIILTEGKKRQIRRMLGELGERVVDLKRVSIGKHELGGLKEGEWEKFIVN